MSESFARKDYQRNGEPVLSASTDLNHPRHPGSVEDTSEPAPRSVNCLDPELTPREKHEAVVIDGSTLYEGCPSHIHFVS
jgi:hypothetical protein